MWCFWVSSFLEIRIVYPKQIWWVVHFTWYASAEFWRELINKIKNGKAAVWTRRKLLNDGKIIRFSKSWYYITPDNHIIAEGVNWVEWELSSRSWSKIDRGFVTFWPYLPLGLIQCAILRLPLWLFTDSTRVNNSSFQKKN